MIMMSKAPKAQKTIDATRDRYQDRTLLTSALHNMLIAILE